VQLSTRLITGIVSFCFALTGLFVANMVLTMMIGEINRKRQEGSLVSYLGFSFPKILRIFGAYRHLYPRWKDARLCFGSFCYSATWLNRCRGLFADYRLSEPL
jgi:hypothetical protein